MIFVPIGRALVRARFSSRGWWGQAVVVLGAGKVGRSVVNTLRSTALERLAEVARSERRPEYARPAERVLLHARTEEAVLYPAAILVGEVVASRVR